MKVDNASRFSPPRYSQPLSGYTKHSKPLDGKGSQYTNRLGPHYRQWTRLLANFGQHAQSFIGHYVSALTDIVLTGQRYIGDKMWLQRIPPVGTKVFLLLKHDDGQQSPWSKKKSPRENKLFST